MKWWIVFVLVILGVGGIVGQGVRRVDNYWLISCPWQYRWQANRQSWREVMPRAEGATLIYLSCELVKTKEGVGAGVREPWLFASRTKWLGMRQVVIYLDVAQAQAYTVGEQAQLAGMLLAEQVAKVQGESATEVQRAGGKAYYAATPAVEIVGL